MGVGDFIKDTTILGQDIFESKTEKEVLQTPGEAAARASLGDTLALGTPNLPKREIVGLSSAEKQAADLTQRFAGSEPEGMQHFRDVLAGGNILDNPAYQALFSKVRAAGDRQISRTGRSLQIRGGTTSGAGAKILGRSQEQAEDTLLASLAPYVAANEAQKMTAAEALVQTGESSILNRLNALGKSGELDRRLKQLDKDTEFARKTTMTLFPWQQSAQLAATILGNKVDWSVTQTPSLFSQVAGPLGMVAGAMVGGPAGAAVGGSIGGGLGAGGGTAGFSGDQTAGLSSKFNPSDPYQLR